MRMAKSVTATAVAAVLMWALVACGGSSEPRQPSGAGLVVDITIANGQVTPSNATFAAKVSEPITLRVTSDAADELHVHSVPDHKFAITDAANQTFQFKVDVPGNVDVELHHLDRTVATIQIRP
jgi:hypothetical protein